MGMLRNCPRCNERTFEKLASHSYCLCCDYTPDLLDYKKSSGDDLPIPPWAAKAAKQMQSTKCQEVVEPIPQLKKRNDKKRRAA
ncbi:MAG: hypothetical protein AB7O96_03550 [Pseudobdellovibrionaceae bacterium]